MTRTAITSNPLVARLLRACVSRLPSRTQRAIAKRYFFGQIKSRRFKSSELEWERLEDWLQTGDCCIDVGANIGRYALKMAELVGPSGHIIAFEPLTRSFDLLTHFVEKGQYKNITLLNAAVTDTSGLISITPDFTPLSIPYIFDTNTGTSLAKAHNAMSENKLGLSLDALGLPQRIKLIKVDVEGHELAVCKGMTALIQRDHPILIIEDHNTNTGVAEFLAQFDYTGRRLVPTSRNLVFTPNTAAP